MRRKPISSRPSWEFKWCTPRCWVRYHKACCFHPICQKRKQGLCSWMNYFTGGKHCLFFILFATFQATPAPNPATSPMAVGVAKCRKSQFLTPPSWTVTPTPIPVSNLKLPHSLPWHFLSALQCRLDCNPGYVAHKTPIITCVNGEYQPQARLWQESQPQNVSFTQICGFWSLLDL